MNAAKTIAFSIKNRWTGALQFEAQIECTEDSSPRIKVGLAVKWAYKSGADLRGADLRGVVLRGADLRGVVLRGVVLRGAVLSDADLSGADLSGADLSGADLSGADLSGADLSDAVLSGAVLRGVVLRDAVLSGAVLRDAVLSGADLSGAVLRGVPVVPNIDASILEAIEAGGKLDMSSWHRCGTTHCRAGWAITLAGAAGAALEFAMGSAAAGALIYAASRPGEKIPDFYCDDAKALADIRASATKASS